MKKKNNFLEKSSKSSFNVFRKRVMGCILATDMAKHNDDVKAMQGLLKHNGIAAGVNAEKIIDRESETSLFKSQQQVLEFTLHFCDISYGSRNFNLVKKWTYELFYEFFNQGDIEKE